MCIISGSIVPIPSLRGCRGQWSHVQSVAGRCLLPTQLQVPTHGDSGGCLLSLCPLAHLCICFTVSVSEQLCFNFYVPVWVFWFIFILWCTLFWSDVSGFMKFNEKIFQMCITWARLELDQTEVTQCGWQDIKIQLLLLCLSVSLSVCLSLFLFLAHSFSFLFSPSFCPYHQQTCFFLSFYYSMLQVFHTL